MAHNLKTKTNQELISLISEAAAELEWRRKANEVSNTSSSDTPPPPNDEDEGGDHPPVVHFP